MRIAAADRHIQGQRHSTQAAHPMSGKALAAGDLSSKTLAGNSSGKTLTAGGDSQQPATLWSGVRNALMSTRRSLLAVSAAQLFVVATQRRGEPWRNGVAVDRGQIVFRLSAHQLFRDPVAQVMQRLNDLQLH